VYRETLWSSLEQVLRSWYVWFYQVPRLPEWLLARDDMANMVESLEVTSNPGTFDAETIDRYRAAWRHTGIEPRINWYRGFTRSERPSRDTVTQPTLVCWGEDDIALKPAMAEASVEYCEDGHLRTFPGASHWVHHERAAVTDAVLRHLCVAHGSTTRRQIETA
jgi:pimeloyl-ACP methyl ester carboxylesterase